MAYVSPNQAENSRRWRLANADKLRKIHADYYKRKRTEILRKAKIRRDNKKANK